MNAIDLAALLSALGRASALARRESAPAEDAAPTGAHLRRRLAEARAARPLIRGRRIRSMLETIDAWPEAAAIRPLVPGPLLVALEQVAPSGWLPLEVELLLLRAVRQALGADGARAFHLADGARALQDSLLTALVRRAAEQTRTDPGEAARNLPVGWRLVFRGCGEWELDEPRPGRRRLRLVELPRACLLTDEWPWAVVGILAGLPALVGRSGSAVLLRASGSTAEFELRWEAGNVTAGGAGPGYGPGRSADRTPGNT
jgi:hypothetical protein